MIYYLELLASIAFGVLNAIGIKLSDGYSKKGWTIVAYASFAVCTIVFVYALVGIPLGIAYAVYQGLLVAIVCVLGIVVWKEGITARKAVAIAAIVVGVVLLELGVN